VAAQPEGEDGVAPLKIWPVIGFSRFCVFLQCGDRG